MATNPSDFLPTSVAGRVEAVMALLAPRAVDTCPTCGHRVEVYGPPLITKAQAMALLALPDLP